MMTPSASVPCPPSSQFVVRNMFRLTAPFFELKQNPNQKLADDWASEWFRSFKLYEPAKIDHFLSNGRFDILGGFGFPDADLEHLQTCFAWSLWAFSTDDFSDSGPFQCVPEQIEGGHAYSMPILYDENASQPSYPNAAMLWDILRRIRLSGTKNNYKRFVDAFLEWSSAQVKQSSNRRNNHFPRVSDFIKLRRSTFGGNLCAAMVEYSLDLNIPVHVIEHPTIVAMSDALIDIMTWPNDVCSFKKEYNDGDYQNLVLVLQNEEKCNLQEAVDKAIDMTGSRVKEYLAMKGSMPSFGDDIDQVLARYFKGYEYFVHASMLWYYVVPRYFGDQVLENLIEKDLVVVHLGSDTESH